ncbi:MAG TPA: ParA family protein [Euryarchaeota archaeon]|nr:MAG: ParA family protein [Thermoplasmata archaeon]HHD15498.1 ParA family protein [Euryarchaeota archaeon]
MARIITIVNQKGGVGKTTTAINLSASLSFLGKRSLLIDTDTQGNTTSGLGFDKNEMEFTIYEVLTGQCGIRDSIIHTDLENLDIIGSNINLAGASVELVNVPEREKILKNALKEVNDEYDFILIDSPPSLGLITLNNLTAAESVLIPLQCEYFALEGMSELLDTIFLVQKNLNPDLTIEGILMTMYDRRTNLSKQVVAEVQNYFGEKVYRTIIPRNVKLGEAPSFGKPSILYAPESTGAQAYMDLAREVIAHG